MKTYTQEEVIKLVSAFYYDGMTFEQFGFGKNVGMFPSWMTPSLFLAEKLKQHELYEIHTTNIKETL